MPRPQEVDVKEAELEELLIKDPSFVEEGISILGRQIRTDTGGSLDILAVDEDKILTVIELKNEEEHNMLFLLTNQ